MNFGVSYENRVSESPLLGLTISEKLKETVAKYPDSGALVAPYQNYRATYQEFWSEVEQVAKGILCYG